MPNPNDVDRDRRDVSIAMSESDNQYTESDAHDEDTKMTAPSQTPEGRSGGEVKKKYDPKDPFRPRRKKARRACFACQRAHLTCGKKTPLS